MAKIHDGLIVVSWSLCWDQFFCQSLQVVNSRFGCRVGVDSKDSRVDSLYISASTEELVSTLKPSV
jgi:hypothetical protein